MFGRGVQSSGVWCISERRLREDYGISPDEEGWGGGAADFKIMQFQSQLLFHS